MVVYFIRNTDTNYYKIGIAKDLKKRVVTLQTSLFNDCLSIDYLIPCNDKKTALTVEKKYHSIFKKHRVLGEWFSIGTLEIPIFITEAYFSQYLVWQIDGTPVVRICFSKLHRQQYPHIEITEYFLNHIKNDLSLLPLYRNDDTVSSSLQWTSYNYWLNKLSFQQQNDLRYQIRYIEHLSTQMVSSE